VEGVLADGLPARVRLSGVSFNRLEGSTGFGFNFGEALDEDASIHMKVSSAFSAVVVGVGLVAAGT
jgi:hypothetical protein